MKENLLFGILKNEGDGLLENWREACTKRNIPYKIIHLTSNNWLEEVQQDDFSCLLACPTGLEARFKVLYDERIYILEKVLGHFIYPDYDEISLHENKRYLSFWLKAAGLPHPATNIFYSKEEAKGYLEKATLPLVGKFNIGASGRGVEVIKSRRRVQEYIDRAFSKRGLHQRTGPNLKMGDFRNRLMSLAKKPKKLLERLAVYKKTYNETQSNFVILQDFIPHDFEWRIVRIGESYFGHKKTKQGDKASGTKGIDFCAVPPDLLDFVSGICNEFKFNSMAVDLFADGQGGYFINEMQTIFGHVQDYICSVNGIPGRYIKVGDNWVFDPGTFNSNLSYDLRLENVLSLL